jgi:hypothetical protein
MTSRYLRLVVAIAVVAVSLVPGQPARAEGEGPAPKCDCYSSLFSYHGVWTISNEFPISLCAKDDCWIPLAAE